MSRLHPFDYAFGPVAESWFPEIRDEATRSGRDTTDRGQFAKLEAVERRLTEMRGAENRGGDEEYLQLLYSAYRLWAAGSHTYEVPKSRLEPALDADTPPAPEIPYGACYVQLPPHWIWSRVAAGAPHEPIDGAFVVPGASGREVLVLAVLGLRGDRGGFSQLVVSATHEDWRLSAGAPRPRFTPAMDGGQAAGFRSVNSNAELLLLASLALTAAGP